MTQRANFETIRGSAAGTSLKVGRTTPTISSEKLKALALGRLNFPAIKEILAGLGFPIADNLQAAAAPVRFGQAVHKRPATETVSIKDLDDALAQVGSITPDLRVRLKSALAAEGLLA